MREARRGTGARRAPRRTIPSLIALLLAGCDSSSPALDTIAAARSVRFVAFGDAGTGSAAQFAVGEAMGAVCRARGCDFALELGDNFYVSGVTSVDDSQFQSKFEVPYESLDVPVYVTLGNHDNSLVAGEGADNARGDHQVEYHYLAGRMSEKFRMPARYYSFVWPEDSSRPLAEFYSLDSNPLTSIVPDLRPEWNSRTYGQAQQEWFDGALARSKARWKIAFGHHPYLSNGLHGNAGNYLGVPELAPLIANGKPWKDFLEATVCARGVDIFFQGHDHELEWTKPVASCGKTHFILSGAASEPRSFANANRNATYWQVDDTLGFFWFELTENQMTGAAFTLDAASKLPVGGAGEPQAAFAKTLPKP